MSTKSEISFKRLDAARFMYLNRPSHLNALNTGMISLMLPQLEAWQHSDLVKAIVVLPQEGSKAFCAGGDVKKIVELAKTGNPDDMTEALSFFLQEYKLNHLIGTLEKPFISVMDGITMGGGVGLSVHAPFRIATEKTVFAMPETKIGFIPDVGGSFFLPRLDGELGTYLGLTGQVLRGQQVLMAGLATHFIPSLRLPNLLTQLSQLETSRLDVINGLLDEYSGDPIATSEWENWKLAKNREIINECFSADSIEEIVERLSSKEDTFAQETLKQLSCMSPTALKVSLKLLRKGKSLNFRDCFQMELGVVHGFLNHPDFAEGVRAVLVDKTNDPKWSKKLNQISDEWVDATFFTFKKAPKIKFSNPKTFKDYPHRSLSGYPTDHDLKRIVQGNGQRGHKMAAFNSVENAREWTLRNWGTFDRGLVGVDAKKLPETLSISGEASRNKVGLSEKLDWMLPLLIKED